MVHSLLIFLLVAFSITSIAHPTDDDLVLHLPDRTSITFEFSAQRTINVLPTATHTLICDTSEAEVYINHDSSDSNQFISKPLRFAFAYPGTEVIRLYRDTLFFGKKDLVNIIPSLFEVSTFYIVFNSKKPLTKIGELRELFRQCGATLEIPAPEEMR